MPRGVGYGAAFAVIVLTLVTLMGTYYIVRAYSSGMAALMNYAEALQKPELTVAGYTAPSERTVIVEIVNKGPGAVLVEGVKLLKHSPQGVPVEATPATNIREPVYLPVGGSLKANFTVRDITDYVFWDKPLRVIVETNKGVYTLSHPTLTGTIYANIHLPT